MNGISVLIVTWNNEKEIRNCLRSVLDNLAALPGDNEVIVVDNNSADKTVEEIENSANADFKLIKNDSNEGYTKGVNKAYKLAKGKFIFLLNPDTILSDFVIKKLVDFLKVNPGYAGAAPKLLNEDKSIQQSVRNFPDYDDIFFQLSLLGYFFPKSQTFGKWKMRYMDYNQSQDIKQPMAAAIMLNNEIINKINNDSPPLSLDPVRFAGGGRGVLMDERFIMFYNDVDLCKRIYDNGYKIRYLSNAEVIHYKGRSVFKAKAKMISAWNKDCVQYFKKHHNNKKLLPVLKAGLAAAKPFRILMNSQ